MDAEHIAVTLIDGFEQFRSGFERYTATAKDFFLESRWAALRKSMQDRIWHSETAINIGSSIIQELPFNQRSWSSISQTFLDHFKANDWYPLAVSYINACLRQAYGEHSVSFSLPLPKLATYDVELRNFTLKDGLPQALAKALSLDGAIPVSNAHSALEQVLSKVHECGVDPNNSSVCVDFFPELFYRNQHAYAVGRIHSGNTFRALVFAYTHTDEGIVLNACLQDESDLLNIFSFSRSYFLVNTASPVGLVNYLGTVMPHKPREQLFINLGFQEMGKDLLLQQFMMKVSNSDKRITYAPGIRGMVMIVFQHPEAEYVFKIVRDKVEPPKTITEPEVIEKYRFVSGQDRVGRMADVQLFKNLALPIDSFDEALKRELMAQASESVRIKDGYMVFRNIFVERKLVPLNVFLKEHQEAENIPVIIDYGYAIKQMALTNIFPGDMLIKNFGVSDKRRVVFYDYDEVMPLTHCRFKSLRRSSTYEEELAMEYPEPVFEGDIFPEEFFRFLVPKGPLRDEFERHHSDLYTPEFWNHWKAHHESGRLMDIQPYVANVLGDWKMGG
ncbi:MAG: bifunctional isocitrate dehydrogenase kinase/phosphatase [Flavobacteriales bacterium]|nr:bifunctional isocitrate dehydrogenase kinase/phosphatase [Flavobacteriales bacterium]